MARSAVSMMPSSKTFEHALERKGSIEISLSPAPFRGEDPGDMGGGVMLLEEVGVAGLFVAGDFVDLDGAGEVGLGGVAG